MERMIGEERMMYEEMNGTSARDDRDGNGRFLPGNRGGPGNPHAKKVAQLRSALLETVTPEDMRTIVLKLVEMAKGGDLPAIRELLERTLGKRVEADFM